MRTLPQSNDQVALPWSPLRALWLAGGLVLSALAVVGTLLPVMPTAIFAVGAVSCFSRSSPRLEAWLLDNRWLGAPLRTWRSQGAIAADAKLLALGSMVVSTAVIGLTAPPDVVVAACAVTAGSALFVATRPTPTECVAC